MNVTLPQTLLTVADLARRVGCDPDTVRARVTRGALRPDFLLGQGLRHGPTPLFRPDRVAEARAALVVRPIEAAA